MFDLYLIKRGLGLIYISADNDREFVLGASRQVAGAGNVALPALQLVGTGPQEPEPQGPSAFYLQFTHHTPHDEPDCEKYSLVIEIMCTLADLFGRTQRSCNF